MQQETLVIGEKIRYYRNLKDLTQEELSLKSGVEQKTISYIENNKRVASMETVYKLALALDLDTLELCILLVHCLTTYLENLKTLRHR